MTLMWSNKRHAKQDATVGLGRTCECCSRGLGARLCEGQGNITQGEGVLLSHTDR